MVKQHFDELNQHGVAFRGNFYDVHLVFEQGEMFDYLKKRASYLKKGKFEEAEQVEKKMTEWKNNNIDKCRTPVHAFITLETEGAKNKINNTRIPFYGDFLKLKRAPEATDVIWENQHVKNK